jgi:hypothetical protein
MAAPHVTGAWAVLKSKWPDWTVDQVLTALTSTGYPITDSRNGITKPLIQVDAAISEPEIDVQRPAGTSILDGGTDELGDQPVGTVTLTYTLDNTAGTGQLDVTDVTAASLVNVSNFLLTTAMPVNVTAGATATFDVSFDVDAGGSFSLEMDIANNDSDENPYIITIQGTGIVDNPPNAPTLVTPLDGSVGVSTSANLEVMVTDPESDPIDVTFYGRESGGSVEDFTIVVLPDTQYYSESYPATFSAQTQWIVDNQVARNIVYVAHEGDVVNDATSTTQWDNADVAMDILDVANIPYGIAPGNHDEDANYNTYFGVSRFLGKSFFGGEYPTNDMQNNYMLFSAGGMDFIVINLDYISPDAGALTWADNLLSTYSTRRAIVVSHLIIYSGGNFSSWGEEVYDALKANPNLFLMMNGHITAEAQRSDLFSGNTVYTLLANYQGLTNGGNGWLRILEFSPDKPMAETVGCAF